MSVFRISEITKAMEGGVIFVSESNLSNSRLQKAKIVNVSDDSMTITIGKDEDKYTFLTDGTKCENSDLSILMYTSIENFHADLTLQNIKEALAKPDINLGVETVLLAGSALNLDIDMASCIHPELIDELLFISDKKQNNNINPNSMFPESDINNNCFDKLWKPEQNETPKSFDKLDFNDILNSNGSIPTV